LAAAETGKPVMAGTNTKPCPPGKEKENFRQVLAALEQGIATGVSTGEESKPAPIPDRDGEAVDAPVYPGPVLTCVLPGEEIGSAGDGGPGEQSVMLPANVPRKVWQGPPAVLFPGRAHSTSGNLSVVPSPECAVPLQIHRGIAALPGGEEPAAGLPATAPVALQARPVNQTTVPGFTEEVTAERIRLGERSTPGEYQFMTTELPPAEDSTRGGMLTADNAGKAGGYDAGLCNQAAGANLAAQDGGPFDLQVQQVFPEAVLAREIVARGLAVWQRGHGYIRLQLKPEFLGEVQVQVTSHRGHIMAVLVVDSELVRSSVQACLPHLQHNLAQLGLSCDRFSVEVSSFGAGSSTDGHAAAHHGGSGGFGQPAFGGGFSGWGQSGPQDWPYSLFNHLA